MNSELAGTINQVIGTLQQAVAAAFNNQWEEVIERCDAVTLLASHAKDLQELESE